MRRSGLDDEGISIHDEKGGMIHGSRGSIDENVGIIEECTGIFAGSVGIIEESR